MDDGKGVVLEGGVVGTMTRELTPFAGVGELLKPNRPQPLSPSLDVREKRC